MAKVLGVGGIFFLSPDPSRLRTWGERWLGIPADPYGTSFKPTKLPAGGCTVWNPFAADTTYFVPSKARFMSNLIVDDVDATLAQVLEGGAEIVGAVEQYDHGRCGWFIDPDGNKVELWQLPTPANSGEHPT
jgi:predicted enzyme related to lactoylglutathione lyase